MAPWHMTTWERNDQQVGWHQHQQDDHSWSSSWLLCWTRVYDGNWSSPDAKCYFIDLTLPHIKLICKFIPDCFGDYHNSISECCKTVYEKTIKCHHSVVWEVLTHCSVTVTQLCQFWPSATPEWWRETMTSQTETKLFCRGSFQANSYGSVLVELLILVRNSDKLTS